MQVYQDTSYFKNFSPQTMFEKWATAEVSDFNTIPDGMKSFVLAGGLYAVFHYIGDASAAGPTFQYIFGTWLPASEYELDHRPHFEILGEKYKNGDPKSEEDIWIPIKLKQS
jgi:AraC family transcriptional regulator